MLIFFVTAAPGMIATLVYRFFNKDKSNQTPFGITWIIFTFIIYTLTITAMVKDITKIIDIVVYNTDSLTMLFGSFEGPRALLMDASSMLSGLVSAVLKNTISIIKKWCWISLALSIILPAVATFSKHYYAGYKQKLKLKSNDDVKSVSFFDK
jgi:hypothetical protein